MSQYLNLLVLSAAMLSVSSCGFFSCDKNCENKKMEQVAEDKAAAPAEQTAPATDEADLGAHNEAAPAQATLSAENVTAPVAEEVAVAQAAATEVVAAESNVVAS